MFGLSEKQAVAEHEASGELERIYHEIKRTLRVTGVNLMFRSWAAHGDFLVIIWDAFRPALATQAFEEAADSLRLQAARAAEQLGSLGVHGEVSLGESQAFQIRAALDLYHYVNPKLLLLTSLLSRLLRGEEVGHGGSPAGDTIPLGAPGKMAAMEMESEEPDDETLRDIYQDIQDPLSLPSINSDYRTLALWPRYLSTVWKHLKPIDQSVQYQLLTDRLRESSRGLALNFPFHFKLTRQDVKDHADSFQKAVDLTESFEQLLPGLIINIGLLESDWRQGTELACSPFPIGSHE